MVKASKANFHGNKRIIHLPPFMIKVYSFISTLEQTMRAHCHGDFSVLVETTQIFDKVPFR